MGRRSHCGPLFWLSDLTAHPRITKRPECRSQQYHIFNRNCPGSAESDGTHRGLGAQPGVENKNENVDHNKEWKRSCFSERPGRIRCQPKAPSPKDPVEVSSPGNLVNRMALKAGTCLYRMSSILRLKKPLSAITV